MKCNTALNYFSSLLKYRKQYRNNTCTYFCILDKGANTPCLALQVKYLCPLTDPSFLPAGLSNSIPYQVPGKRLKFTHRKSRDTSYTNFILFKKKKTLNMISPNGDIKVSEFI